MRERERGRVIDWYFGLVLIVVCILCKKCAMCSHCQAKMVPYRLPSCVCDHGIVAKAVAACFVFLHQISSSDRCGTMGWHYVFTKPSTGGASYRARLWESKWCTIVSSTSRTIVIDWGIHTGSKKRENGRIHAIGRSSIIINAKKTALVCQKIQHART